MARESCQNLDRPNSTWSSSVGEVALAHRSLAEQRKQAVAPYLLANEAKPSMPPFGPHGLLWWSRTQVKLPSGGDEFVGLILGDDRVDHRVLGRVDSIRGPRDHIGRVLLRVIGVALGSVQLPLGPSLVHLRSQLCTPLLEPRCRVRPPGPSVRLGLPCRGLDVLRFRLHL